MGNDSNSYTEMYRTGTNDSSSIQIKRDTSQLKQNIYLFLKGYADKYEPDENGVLVKSREQIVDEKLNDTGIQSVMMIIEGLVNSSTVAGNINEADYKDIVADFHHGLYNDLFVNSRKYNLADDDFNSVVLTLTSLVRVFITRPIGDKERQHESNIQIKEAFSSNPGESGGKGKWRLW